MGAGQLTVLVAVCLMSGAYGGPDNRGTEFILGFMENQNLDFPLEMFVTTSRTTAVTVTVTAPRYSSANLDSTFTVIAGEVKQLMISNRLRGVATEMSTKGIHVVADDEVVVYGVNKERYSNDAYLGLPVDVLGTEYVAVSYYPPKRYCLAMVVATEDNTRVSILLGQNTHTQVSYGGRTYNGGSWLNVTMNRFDTFEIHSYGDLTGSRILSDKPIAAYSGNKKTDTHAGRTQDHLTEMLIPVSTWGKNFATISTPERIQGDIFKFISSEANTNIDIECAGSSPTTYNFNLAGVASWKQQIIAAGSYCSVVSDKPIMVVMIVYSMMDSSRPADPAMSIIPPKEQFAADYTFTTPKYSLGSYESFIMVIIKDADKDGLKINGNAFGANYHAIPNSDLVTGYVQVSDGTYNLRHDSPIKVFGAFTYGRAHAESYSFLCGLRLAPINSLCLPTTSSDGDGLDNDCDGLIDEELCTPENQGADDDGDGVVDEDCALPSPIDGGWASWENWGTTCFCANGNSGSSNGLLYRYRDCSDPVPKYDGLQCPGDDYETTSCTRSGACPVSGGWSDWTQWTSCSVTCEKGVISRERECNNPTPQNGGDDCRGDERVERECSTGVYCPVHGGWSSWNAWSTCTLTCGGGTYDHSRTCTNPVPFNNGNDCVGSATESSDCNTNGCPVDGGWDSWSAWSACSVTCGSGTATRSRGCNSPAPLYGGAQCSGDSSATQACNPGSCAVDGGWSSWSAWSSCSVTCSTGTTGRSRTCDNPAPAHGGAQCSGDLSETTSCNPGYCPVDGGWGSWSVWTSCTVTCGGGTSTRSRSCDNPAPAYNGAQCSGAGQETDTCNTLNCPVDGGWTSWTAWSCAVTCGNGTASRSRSCDNPAPAYNGAACSGDTSGTEPCFPRYCPVDGGWSVWSAWSSCSVTCAAGTVSRSRSCDNPAPNHGGASCSGSGSDSDSCNPGPCPIDGAWASWEAWSNCTAACGGGTTLRVRRCNDPAPNYGGAACAGTNNETDSCNTDTCPMVNGAWGDWQAWSACSTTCNMGRKLRMRYCDSPAPFNGSPCPGDSLELETCDLGACSNTGSSSLTGASSTICPTGYMACRSGGILCVEQAFVCDCTPDCDDASDEETTWAACSASLQSVCKNGDPGLVRPSVVALLLGLLVAVVGREVGRRAAA